VPESTTVSAA
jgi:hypothetical protein